MVCVTLIFILLGSFFYYCFFICSLFYYLNVGPVYYFYWLFCLFGYKFTTSWLVFRISIIDLSLHFLSYFTLIVHLLYYIYHIDSNLNGYVLYQPFLSRFIWLSVYLIVFNWIVTLVFLLLIFLFKIFISIIILLFYDYIYHLCFVFCLLIYLLTYFI